LPKIITPSTHYLTIQLIVSDKPTITNFIIKTTKFTKTALENDLFFDDVYTVSHISMQANLLANKLAEVDEIIAIGHVGIPGPIVANVLEQYIPVYENKANLV